MVSLSCALLQFVIDALTHGVPVPLTRSEACRKTKEHDNRFISIQAGMLFDTGGYVGALVH
jgi:hypothetical protein